MMLRKLALLMLVLALFSLVAAAQDEAQYAGLDMDLSGVHIKAAIDRRRSIRSDV